MNKSSSQSSAAYSFEDVPVSAFFLIIISLQQRRMRGNFCYGELIDRVGKDGKLL